MITFQEYRILNEEFDKIPNTQYGSNPGGIFKHKTTGVEHYIKFPNEPMQADVEVAASKLYNIMGIRTINPEIHEINGRRGVKSVFDPTLKTLRPEQFSRFAHEPEHAVKLMRIHHAAVITGNRDVVGISHDNILHDPTADELVSIDQGGSMHFRAQGEAKPYDKDIDLVDAFKSPKHTAGHVFGPIGKHTPNAGKEAAKSLHALTDDKIDVIMKEHGLPEHAETVKARRDMLIKHYGV